jgi:FkbM family methyltransferase
MKIVKTSAAFAIKSLGSFWCRHAPPSLSKLLERFVGAFHRALNNVNFDMMSNGEWRVLRIITSRNPSLIFDVGANKGEWSLLASQMSPRCIIHSFEIVPSTYKSLELATKNIENIVTVNSGLSNENGTIPINIGPHSDTSTAYKINAMEYHNQYYNQEIDCTVIKASDYLIEKNVAHIDFVKIDVEGMDLKVIEGFEEALNSVQAIQFEYGVFNIASHDLLADFFCYLKKRDFVVGKIFPKYVQFMEYDAHMENFHGSNFIAVKSNQKDLIRELRG